MPAGRALAHGVRSVCAYCGEPVLTGRERPEHPIPAAIGSSLMIQTVCDGCNEWANLHVDQPFLQDDQVRIYRARHDVRDWRQARPRRIRHPLMHGTTEDGRRVTIGEDGRPEIAARIVDHGDGTFRISASSNEEADKLLRRLTARLEPDGFEPRITSRSEEFVRPMLEMQVSVDLRRWTRVAAKLTLGVGSVVYEPEWRTSSDAERLRRIMNGGEDEHGNVVIPVWLDDDHVMRTLVTPPEHVVYFGAHGGTTTAVIVLFGEALFGLPIETEGRTVPDTAWRLDPARPRTDGRTTFTELVADALRRHLV